MNFFGLPIIFCAFGQAWFFFSPYLRMSTALATTTQASGGEPRALSSWIDLASRQLTASVALSIAGIASASSALAVAFSFSAASVILDTSSA
jgi:hypothetical protein